MMRTTKISIAIDKEQLRLARKVAAAAGISLSALIGRALNLQLEEERRRAAARELISKWGPESVPTDAERAEILAKIRRKPKRNKKKAA
jgi:hypothetical protein